MMAANAPRLAADIGSTFVKFAVIAPDGAMSHLSSLPCADFADLRSAVAHYMNTVPQRAFAHAAMATANPVDGDDVQMTNSPWRFSIEQTRLTLGLETLVVVNDFTALAMALPRLNDADLRQIGGGHSVHQSVKGLLGSGSGLGVSGLIPSGDGWVSLGSEGGHTTFSPCDAREEAVMRHARTLYDHVSFERLLSASGLELMHRALAAERGVSTAPLSARDITQRALKDHEPLCLETLDVFCAILGTTAANLAVTLGARGGIYIGGSIVPRLGDYFDRSRFRERFEDKGRFRNYLAAIPTYVITAEHATLIGTAAILDAQLRQLDNAPVSPLLSQIRRMRNELPRAEMRVADLVLSRPRTMLNNPIHAIAVAAEVSQPTVVRFCRSLGCKGLSDFKLRLASSLTGSVPVTHSQVTKDDATLELSSKVLENTANAVLHLRSELNQETLDRAVDCLTHATRIEVFEEDPVGVAAQDVQAKLLGLGLDCSVPGHGGLQKLTAGRMAPGSVALLLCPSGRSPELLALSDTLVERRIPVVAVTTSRSQLARRALAALVLDEPDPAPATDPSMTARILYLALIDVLVVGVSMRRRS